ncbi:alpha/beta fold hydrolase [Patulibacter minatonensis]|uniref:alpha/beta fold hydrolase n=1 Tax=Patulibacter minatonensis TaxID=298163 RepID=UPI000478E8E6|nr:alpha/beta hydrolase [Patulibacter minatonensis]
MEVRRTTVGAFPALRTGAGRPLVVLAGLSPDVGVDGRAMRSTHRAAMRPFAAGADVHYVNRRRGLPRGSTMADLAAEHADAIRSAFEEPVDLAGLSTGGSLAQQLAADHPDVVRRLVLLCTACRLSPRARAEQARAAAAVRAGRPRRAFAELGRDLAPGPVGRLTAAAAWLAGPRLFPDPSDLADMATTIEAEDAFDLAPLATITAPTLLVAGGRDVFYPRPLVDETLALIPDSRLDLHPRRGHVGVLSAPSLPATVATFLA